MSPAALLTSLRGRGIVLAVAGDRIRFRPAEGLTAEEREALAAHKPAVLELLRTEAEAPVPDGPCGLCGGVLFWVEDWPAEGDQRWLCTACAAMPVPSLGALYGTLSPDDRVRLDAEVEAGEPLALLVRAALGQPR